MNPIGFMRTPFKFKNGTPRQPTVCSHARGSLRIEKSVFNNPEHSLEGLDEFSHIWILFIFHKNNNEYTKAKVKPPRLNGKKAGLFSTRSPYRPNNIGLSLAKLESVNGSTVTVSGIDILDGTPVLDIKPYIPEYDCPSLWRSNNNGADLMHKGDPSAPYADNNGGNTSDVNGYSHFVKCQDHGNETCQLKSLPNSDTTDMSLGNSDESDRHELHEALKSSSGKSEKKPEKGDLEFFQVEREKTVSDYVTSESCYASSCIYSDHASSGEKKEDERKNYTGEITANISDQSTKEVLNVENEGIRNLPAASDTKKTESSNTGKGSGNITETRPNDELLLRSDIHLEIACNVPQTAEWIAKPNIEKLTVRFTPSADKQLDMFSEVSQSELYMLKFLKFSEAKEAIISILQEDPRSTYRRKQCCDSLYYFTVDCMHVTCWFDENIAEIVRIKPAALVEQCRAQYV